MVTDDALFERKVRKAVEGVLAGSLAVSGEVALPWSPQELLATTATAPTEVILLGPGVAEQDAIKFAAACDVQFPEVSVVLVAEPAPELALPAMRAGIRDIVPPNADVESIRVVLERACRTAEIRASGAGGQPEGPGRPTGRVIVIASPKGGVGKTTIATNLALALGRIAPMSTVLVDSDVQFGDVAHALQLSPETTLEDAVSQAAKEDSMVLKAFLTVHHGSIYALCAPASPAAADGVSGEDIAHLLGQLMREFRYVVVDTAPGLGEHALAALEGATDAVMVTGLDVPGVRGMRTELDILNSLGLLIGRRRVLVNMVDPAVGMTIRDVEATLGVPVDVAVPRSKEVALSTNTGIPLVQKQSRGPFIKALGRLAGEFDPNRPQQDRKGTHRRAEVIR